MRTTLAIAALAATIGNTAYAEDVDMKTHPFEECLEAGEFIRNAALSRDSGITRDHFMSRLANDLVAIKAYPVHLRWFVYNEHDEIMITNAAARVFDAPQPPRRHEIEFIDECMRSPLWRLEPV